MLIKSGRGRLSSTNSLTEKTLRNCPCEYAAWPPSCQSPTCQRPAAIRPVPDFESVEWYSGISEICSQSRSRLHFCCGKHRASGEPLNPTCREPELYLAVEDIDHSRTTKTKSPQTNDICERFHKTSLNEFYRVAFRKNRSTDELQADLYTWIKEYNEARPHQGRWCFGKTPMQTFLRLILARRAWTRACSGHVIRFFSGGVDGDVA